MKHWPQFKGDNRKSAPSPLVGEGGGEGFLQRPDSPPSPYPSPTRGEGTDWLHANIFYLGFILLMLCILPGVAGAGYDPLALPTHPQPKPLDITVTDTARQREIPLRVYLPAGQTQAPIVLFSHGLGGSREGNAYMGLHWAARGYAVVFIQHPGSDTSVWRNSPARDRMAALHDAASLENFMLRVKDVPAVLDQLEVWNKTTGHILQNRLNLKRVAMSGHSFGAVTTQAVSGQKTAQGKATFTDPRSKAALAFSPSKPRLGSVNQAFGDVPIPWLLMTGTKDVSSIGNIDVAARLAVYPALPPGGKYELVLDQAEHSAFTDRALPGETGSRNPNHHRVILALSTAFLDAWVQDNPTAKAWLQGAGPRTVMEKHDHWQWK